MAEYWMRVSTVHGGKVLHVSDVGRGALCGKWLDWSGVFGVPTCKRCLKRLDKIKDQQRSE